MFTDTRLYEASVLVNGRPITEVYHNGLTYLEGRKNSTFTLRFSNWSWRPVLVIPSVDGFNVIDRLDCGKQSPGYVVEARSTLEIPGWTLDNEAVGKFIFRNQGESAGPQQTFAEAMGEPKNQGAIGFMVFEQAYEPLIIKHVYQPYNGGGWGNDWYGGGYGNSGGNHFDFGNTVIGSSAEARGENTNETLYSAEVKSSNSTRKKRGVAPDAVGEKLGTVSVKSSVTLDCNIPADEVVSVNACHTEPSLGTGMGKEVEFKTHSVDFKRKSTEPEAVLWFRYDNLSNLKRMGVPTEMFRPARKREKAVNPFPASPEVAQPDVRLPTWYRRRSRRHNPPAFKK